MSTTARLMPRLESLLGADRVRGEDPVDASGYSVDGVSPRAIVKPATPAEIAQLVQFAVSEKLSLLPCGSRSKLELGLAPERYDIAVDLTTLQSVAHYDAADLTLGVGAGLRLRQLAEFLGAQKQFLPLAVPCFETSTVGGAIASEIDSALRQQYGTARDFLIGAEFVDGSGQLCKSGGRVAENVGHDLHKLLIGSLGTLGIITRLNFRTFPLPEATSGMLASFAQAKDALAFRAYVETSKLPVTNVEALSPETVTILGAILSRLEDPPSVSLPENQWNVYVSLEGPATVLRRIRQDIESFAARNHAALCERLDSPSDEAIGGMLRESFEWLRWAAPQVVLLRIVSRKAGAGFAGELAKTAETRSRRHALLFRAAGIIYFALFAEGPDESEQESLASASMAAIRLTRAAGGYAQVLHAPRKIKQAASEVVRTGLNLDRERRVKQAFDPQNVFAPGRIVGAV